MHNEVVRILAIESSCDDTSAAVLENSKVLSNIISTQEMHKKYGGVVPELASRSHQKNILPVTDTALKTAGIQVSEIDAIAYTRGPGLPGSLIVGSAFSKSLSLALNIPLIEVNHMQAHVLAHFIESGNGVPEFPFLCLTISGGHTQIVFVESHFNMRVVGSTIDDAAGEAFDKVAKMLGLEYPGGPLIDKLAVGGNSAAFSFPKPQVPDFNFSFSGFKTSVLYFLRKKLEEDSQFVTENLSDICASVQRTITEILIEKLDKAADHFGICHVALAGGVSANSAVRKALLERESAKGWKVFIPPVQYCTDNAAMIGIAAYFKFQSGDFSTLETTPSARLAF